MTTQKTEQVMREIFVVDGGLEINPVQVAEAEWQSENNYFGAKIGSQPIIVLRGGWNKYVTYAGFETRKEAEEFKAAIELIESQEAKK